MPSSEEDRRPGRSTEEPATEPVDEPVTDEWHAARQEGQEETVSSAEVDREHAEMLRRVVSAKSQRRIRARERPNESVWAFLGTFGLVGWTIAVPTLAGLALGVYIDGRTDSERSFTITFLVLGVAVGCVTAWYWIRRESSGDGQ